MEKRTGVVTFAGGPITLVGPEVKVVITLSDHKDASFGENYGFLIEELRLLTRGVVVINKENKVTYVEYVPEVTQAVNFDAALEAIKADI